MRITHTQQSCFERWTALKARGDYTATEINAIDKDTPRWWIEMMDEERRLRGLPDLNRV